MKQNLIIREAKAEDNEALLALDRQCSMGEGALLSFDRSPDFFARSRPYEQFQLFVAEAEGAVVGIGGAAIKRLRIKGEWLKAAYFYDLRVDPAYRRMGVAAALGDALRDSVRKEAVELGYSLVAEVNIPSLQFVAKRGSQPVRRCILAILSAHSPDAEGRGAWRPLAEEDVDQVSPLIKRSFQDHDLVPSFDVVTLKGLIRRAPGLSFQDLYGLEAEGRLVACFGLWNYSGIMRISVRGAGEVSPYFLLPLAFEAPALLTEVIHQTRRLLAERQCDRTVPALFIPYDPEDSAFAPLRGFEGLELPIYLFAFPIREGLVLGKNPLYLDPLDL
jgi:GNAT superfamily N-acetyltransferase